MVRNPDKLTNVPRDGSATRERILDAAQRIVLERGFAATSVDAVLEEAPATKGAFFHHFPSKNDLGRALLKRYAAAELASTQPGCLYVSFIYESQLAGDGEHDLIATSIRHWRSRLLDKLEAAARVHPPATEVDLHSLADQVFTTFEGGFILARAMHDPTHLRAQLAHLRHYLELLFQLPPTQPEHRQPPTATALPERKRG